MAYSQRAYVEHAAIRVADIVWHIRFFRDVLGMTLRDDRRGETPSQVWTIGGVQLMADPGFQGPEGRLALSASWSRTRRRCCAKPPPGA